MAKDVIEIADSDRRNKIEVLTEKWQEAKAAREAADKVLFDIECELYETVQPELKDKGTNNFWNGLSIVTGYNEKWDQGKLKYLLENDTLALVPFRTELKPDAKQLHTVRESFPEDYKKLEECLTVSLKKPSFSIKEKE